MKRETWIAAVALLPAFAWAQAVSIGGGTQPRQPTGNPTPAHRLKQRQVSPRPAADGSLNALVLKAVAEMPQNGGYSVGAKTARKLANQAVVWNEKTGRLELDLHQAQPSFCSAACYVALLHTLELWERSGKGKLPAEAWKKLDMVLGTPDGKSIWGRANANGPGFAKLFHDLGAGVNFSALELAQPGDFLKFFWTDEIGAKERGHMVVFLGTEQKDGETCVKYWSANKPDGYSERSIPLSKMHHLIFTRLTAPEKLAGATGLPETDAWLRDMQKVSVPYGEVVQKCGIITQGAAAPQSPRRPSQAQQ